LSGKRCHGIIVDVSPRESIARLNGFRVHWFSLVFPDSLDFLVASEDRLSICPRERWGHIGRMPEFKAGPRNILLVSPGDVRDVAVLDPDLVERFGGWSCKRRSCGLVKEYV